MSKLKVQRTTAQTAVTYAQPTVDRAVSSIKIGGNYIGGTGGNTNQSVNTIQAQVKVGSNAVGTGWIVAQKGIHKFRATDGAGNYGDCKLVNLATPTASNTMSIAVYLNAITQANIAAANVAGGATSTYVTYSTANVVGPGTIGVNSVLTGFTTGNASSVTVTAINGTVGLLANVTVSVTGNIAQQLYTNINNTVYASRINNKYVSDFGSDGKPVTSSSGSYTGGANNPNRYRYWLYTPNSTFVQVASA